MVSSSPKELSSPEGVDAKGGVEEIKNGKKSTTTRRRTKTGCLTCRRRRIKCGEERPICKNCIKSKRECAGYIQPLVYKQQQPQIPPQPGRTPTMQLGFAEQGVYPDLQHQTDGQPSHVHPNIAASAPPPNTTWTWPPLISSQALAEQLQWPDRDQEWTNLAQPRLPNQLYVDTQVPSFMGNVYQHYPVSQYPGRRPSQALTEATLSTGPGSGTRSTVSTPYQRHPSNTDLSFTHLQSEPNSADITKAFEKARIPSSNFEAFAHSNAVHTDDSQPLQYTAHGFLLRKSMPSSDILQFPTEHYRPFLSSDEPDDPDDPWDVESEAGAEDCLVKFDRPAHPSPLLDERYSQFFHHAMAYVIPGMNIFERAPSIDSQGVMRSTWGKYLPNAAVSRSALAHAFLALGALNLAAIRGTGEDAAVKHFTYALRRVSKMLAMPNRRHEASTLATVLLLGFYEVLCGDHARWITHLAGASSFVMEHDFAGMTRAVRRMRSRARQNIEQPWVDRESLLSNHDYIRIADIPEALLHDDDWEVDQNLVSRLTGLDIDYDRQEQSGVVAASPTNELTAAEVEDWKTKMDLYWWFCKMDVFHSALSGDPLLRSYEQWKYCPPRGPIGRIASVCATTDHLWLVLARLVDFGGKDVKRKQQAIAAAGGHWQPAPGFLGSAPPMYPDRQPFPNRRTSVPKADRSAPPPSANEGRARSMKSSEYAPSSPPAPTGPVFNGMIPALNVSLPMNTSFHTMKSQMQGDTLQANEYDLSDENPTSLDAQLHSALAQHREIDLALETWSRCLGPDFEAIAETRESIIRTPFGPAIRYANPVIAGTWAYYYLAKILLRRLHPHSPPASMVSTGVNAPFTRDYAQMIGRIIGGLHAGYDAAIISGKINATLIGSLQETTLPLLFAAVQFQDAGQRGWTINKLSDVAENTGWRSSTAVASACEMTWHEMGKNGKGPPYEKTLNKKGFDVRMRSKHHFESTSFPTSDERQVVSHDRRQIAENTSARAFWALGVLAVEEDLKKMTI